MTFLSSSRTPIPKDPLREQPTDPSRSCRSCQFLVSHTPAFVPITDFDTPAAPGHQAILASCRRFVHESSYTLGSRDKAVFHVNSGYAPENDDRVFGLPDHGWEV